MLGVFAAALATGGPAAFPPGFQVHAGGGATFGNGAVLSSTVSGRYRLSAADADVDDAPSRPQDAADVLQAWSSISVERGVVGVVSVVCTAEDFALHRQYIAKGDSKVLVNDTFTCRKGSAAIEQPHAHTDRCPLYTNHTVTMVLPSNQSQVEVQLNGGFNAPQLSECSTDIVRGNNGNPSVVASFSSGGGVGFMPLDDVFRAHVYAVNRASPTRVPGHAPCAVADPPAFDVVDPYLALIEGQSYTAEWAIYLLDETVVQPEVQWEFTNRLVEIPVANRDSAPRKH